MAAIGLAAPPVWAVDEAGLFELEVDADPNEPQTGGENLTGDDWQTLHEDVIGDCVPFVGGTDCGDADLFTGIRNDPSGVTIFTGGDKDIQDIDELGNTSGSTPPKNEIQHAFAAAYTCGDPGSPAAIDCEENDLIIYFGLDRDSHNGDAFLGFWFFKKEVLANNGGFDGEKSPGDLLMLVNFPQASNAVPFIAAVEWDPGCPKKDDNTPDPGECVAKNLRLIEQAKGQDMVECNSEAGTATPLPVHLFCASTNSSTHPSPWPYVPKDSGETDGFLPFETFYEGGVNLTALANNGGTCITSFMAESRSSSSFTAQLKDFLLADFKLCGINAAKSCPSTRLGGEGLCQDTGLTCTGDSDCSARVCSLDDGIGCSDDATCSGQSAGTCLPFPVTCNQVNPQFVAGSDFITQFLVTINREGPGTLFDVNFQEKAMSPIAANPVCQIIGQDGSLLAMNDVIDLTFETPVEVIEEMTATSSTLTVECVTDTNVSLNRIIVDAKSSASLGSSDLGGPTSDGDVPASISCAASVNPDIDIMKECLPEMNDLVKTTITATGVEFTIPAEITVTNTGNEDLVDVFVQDVIAGISEGPFELPALIGNVKTIDATYTTAFPDGTTGQMVASGCNIMFTNTAKVTAAEGASTGDPLNVTSPQVEDSDTCPLCPDSCPGR